MATAPCLACGQPNLPGKRFCRHCGAALPATCTACGAVLSPDARFCDECGAPLAAPAPRAAAAPSVPPRAPALEEQFTTFQRGLPAAFREQLLTQPEG